MVNKEFDSLAQKGEYLHGKLNEHLKSGVILIRDETWQVYLVWFFSFLALWMAFFFSSNKLFLKCGIKSYIEKNDRFKLKMRAAMMGNLHHIVIVVLAAYMLATRCDENDDFPVKDTDATSFKWFSSTMC